MRERLQRLVRLASTRAQTKRAQVFVEHFGESINTWTRILDLESEDGRNIAGVLKDTLAHTENVVIADIPDRAVRGGNEKFDFTRVVLAESGPLQFKESAFDILYIAHSPRQVRPHLPRSPTVILARP